MPPRKAKLHSSTGKLKTINKAYTLPSGSPPSSATSSTSNTNRSNDTAAPRSQAGSNAVTQTNMQHSVTTEVPEINDRVVSIASHDTEADQQFELELCWCIQTLEKSLEASNLSAKQAADTDKTIKLLKSHNQPVIRKRQVMRTAFGDYRSKMQDEEKKLRLGSRQIQFVAEPAKNDEAITKSHFVKKSLAASLGAKHFKFDFPVPEIEKLTIGTAPIDAGVAVDSSDQTQSQPKTINNTQTASNALKFIQSGNSFRFNFNSQN